MSTDIKVCLDKHVEDAERASYHALRESERNLPSPALLSSAIAAGMPHPEAAVMLTGKRWAPGRVITVSFLDGGEWPELRSRVCDQIKVWSRQANLRFDFLGMGDGGDVRVTFERGGSWSYLGTDNLLIPRDQPTMQLGWLTPDTEQDEVRRVVVHEAGHVLALGHEHQHPEGGIPWNKEAAYAYYAKQGWSRAEVDAQVFKTYSVSQTNYTAYDPHSIMHYAIPADLLTDPSRAVGWNTYRSRRDKRFAARVYPKNTARSVLGRIAA